MAQSLNTAVDFVIKASYLGGLDAYGQIMIGDKAFEFYNDRNVSQNIQIPWETIDYIAASVYFKRYIPRFMIRTSNGMKYTFASRDSRKLLSHCRKFMPDEKLVHSLTLWQSIKNRFRRKFKTETA